MTIYSVLVVRNINLLIKASPLGSGALKQLLPLIPNTMPLDTRRSTLSLRLNVNFVLSD